MLAPDPAPIVRPLMKAHGVPAMAVAVATKDGTRVWAYGARPDAIFEIGSVTKTFTATLAAVAVRQGKLAWTDAAPEGGTALQLATHTAGWPLYAPGARGEAGKRLYSNVGVAILARFAAGRLGLGYEAALKTHVLDPVGLADTRVTLSPAQAARYLPGHPRRMSLAPGEEGAYGLKSTAGDLARWLGAQTTGPLAAACADARAPRVQAGAITQALMWEATPWPADRKGLRRGFGQVFQAIPTRPVGRVTADMLVHKTGSTAGFSAWVGFRPAVGTGVVLLANKAMPVAPRVEAGLKLLEGLSAR